MNASLRLLVLGLLAGLLAACGGGGGGASTPSGASAGAGSTATPATAPPATGTPTANLAQSQSAAGDAVNLANSGVGAITTIGAAGVYSTPSSTPLTPATGVTSSGTLACPVSGSEDYSANLSNPSAGVQTGDTLTLTFVNCVESSANPGALNGVVNADYTSVTSANTETLTISTSNLTYTLNGTVLGPYDFTGTDTEVNGVHSYSYTVGLQTVVGVPVVTVTGTLTTVASGVVRVNYASGWVQISYTNWVYDPATGQANAGTAVLTASNGDTATITASSSGYAISIDINGATVTYTVP